MVNFSEVSDGLRLFPTKFSPSDPVKLNLLLVHESGFDVYTLTGGRIIIHILARLANNSEITFVNMTLTK